ncbi:hypothetical protein N7501_009085 [Penicillium viridicatum]|nr:hypothetical protein N7501_009085 [Penicillium viridicatum]
MVNFGHVGLWWDLEALEEKDIASESFSRGLWYIDKRKLEEERKMNSRFSLKLAKRVPSPGFEPGSPGTPAGRVENGVYLGALPLVQLGFGILSPDEVDRAAET